VIEWQTTERGFGRGDFKDLYDVDCSIQESSLATEEAIWLGCDHETHNDSGRACGARMHLTREMAGELAQILMRFSYTGELRPPSWRLSGGHPPPRHNPEDVR
jgi:hypothetical protein